MRSDARENRELLMAAADRLIAERGIDVPVSEITQAAGVGRATFFRNFPTKEELLVAIAVDRMHEALEDGRALLESSEEEDSELAFVFIADLVARQQENRALMEALSEQFLTHPEVRAVHTEIMSLIDTLLDRGKKVGAIRPEAGAVDVILLVKGMCMAAEEMHTSQEMLERFLDLVRAALTTVEYQRPLKGRTPRPEDLERQLLGADAAKA